MTDVKKISVIGAGQMGSGIVQTAAAAGYAVAVYDAFEGTAERAKAAIIERLNRQVEKGRMKEEDAKRAADAVVIAGSLAEAAGDADLVIEAAIEDIREKQEIFRTLDETAPPETILASNTSGLPITEIAAATKRPGKVIGMHFFNPVPVMKLIEVIKGYQTDQETLDTILAVGERMGKVCAVALDKAGFIVSRALDSMLNECIYMLEEGVGTAEDIDKAMKYGCNHPMGPLELTDMIGLDVILAVMETLYREFGDQKYRPCPLLRKMVRAGKLGRKTGEGFYRY